MIDYGQKGNPDWLGFYVLGHDWKSGCPPNEDEIETAFRDICGEVLHKKMGLVPINDFYGLLREFGDHMQKSEIYSWNGITIDLTVTDFQRTCGFGAEFEAPSWMELFLYGQEGPPMFTLIHLLQREIADKYHLVQLPETKHLLRP